MRNIISHLLCTVKLNGFFAWKQNVIQKQWKNRLIKPVSLSYHNLKDNRRRISKFCEYFISPVCSNS